MKKELYSELRTIYETAADNPHTFRVSLKMKDMVDERILRESVATTMRRYPYFSVRMEHGEDGFAFVPNERPVPVLHQDEPAVLASPQTDGHLFAVCFWKNKIHLEVYHALTDGAGIYELIKTLLYYYCSAYYGVTLSAESIRLADSPVDPAEWEDPARAIRDYSGAICVEKWNKPAYQLVDGGRITLSPDCICYNIRIPEAEFMRFNLSNDGSPGTIVALFLARAIQNLRTEKGGDDPVVIAMCVNQRRAIRAPLAHQSLVGDVRIVYDERIAKFPFMRQATCFRGMVALQSDTDMVLKELSEYASTIDALEALPDENARHEYCVDLMNRVTKSMSATISYVGKANFGEAEKYIQEFHVLPATALPSSATPLTLELSAVNGSFYVNFMQYFPEQDYLDAFIRELRANDINYDVLYLTPTNYPLMGKIW